MNLDKNIEIKLVLKNGYIEIKTSKIKLCIIGIKLYILKFFEDIV